MGTRVYGRSDDLLEFVGDLNGECGYYGSDEDDDMGILVAFSDGTILCARYGKPGLGGVWAISVMRMGELFDRFVPCTDEDAIPYSDEVFFRDGRLKAWIGNHGQQVS